MLDVALKYRPANIGGVGVTEDDWITTDEASSLTGYNPEYLRRLVRTRKVRGKKFGRTWQISRRDVLAYLKAESEDARRGPRD